MSAITAISAGTLTPMIIKSFADDEYSQSKGSYTVLINPDKYQFNYKIKHSKTEVPGASAQTLKFQEIEPASLNFEITFDTTGIFPGSSGDVNDQIVALQKVIYDYEGDIHSPYYLEVCWGSIFFRGVLSSMDVSFTLFSPQGIPLRAKASLTLTNTLDPAVIAAEQNQSSPDMTHIRMVVEGDTLPLMCFSIYGDDTMYLEVARHNKLDHFTSLRPGTMISFPPVSK